MKKNIERTIKGMNTSKIKKDIKITKKIANIIKPPN